MVLTFNNITGVRSFYSTILIRVCKSNSSFLCHTRIRIKFAQNKPFLLQFLWYIIMRDLNVLVYNVIVIPVSNDISLLLDRWQRSVTIRWRYTGCFSPSLNFYVIPDLPIRLKPLKYCFCEKKLNLFTFFMTTVFFRCLTKHHYRYVFDCLIQIEIISLEHRFPKIAKTFNYKSTYKPSKVKRRTVGKGCWLEGFTN